MVVVVGRGGGVLVMAGKGGGQSNFELSTILYYFSHVMKIWKL